MQLILLGPPGTDTGRQAAILSKHWQVPHISVGNLLRIEVAKYTLLGVQAYTYMQVGDLVPDEIVLEVVSQRLEQQDIKKSWVLDGFPRNLTQAYALQQWLNFARQSQPTVICFEATVPSSRQTSLIKERLSSPLEADIFHRRWEVYQQETMPLISLYRQRRQLIFIDRALTIQNLISTLESISCQLTS
ncbi:MAG: nucleoside monophosphate kinase [Cyanobacteria bacterium J06638_20]